MSLTRREFGKLALAGIPAMAAVRVGALAGGSAQAGLTHRAAGSVIDGVQFGLHARRQGRYKELTAKNGSVPGNAAAGKEYFEKACTSCHSAQGDFAKIGDKYDSADLESHLLRPDILNKPQSWKLDQLRDFKTAAARQRHFSLLENYSASEAANLLAYLQTLK